MKDNVKIGRHASRQEERKLARTTNILSIDDANNEITSL